MSQPSQQYLVTGLDPTGFTEITAAQLLTMVNGITPESDKGVVIVTVAAAPSLPLFPNGVPNVPDAVGTPEWQNCIWISVFNSFVTAYVWNTNGATDPTYLNWITLSQASIGAGAIQGYQIAAGAITSANISSVSSSSITGSVVAGWLAQLNLAQTAYVTNGLINNNSPIFGDLNGTGSTVAQPVIGALAVTSGKIALQAVAGNATAGQSQIQDHSVVSQQIKINGALATVPLSAGATAGIDPQTNITTPVKSILGLPSTINYNPVGGVAVEAGHVLAVNYDSIGNIDGFVTNSRGVLNVDEPGVQTYNQALVAALGGTTYALANSNGASFGRYLQVVSSFIQTKQTCAAAGSQSIADSAVSLTTAQSSGLAVTITPLMGTSASKLKVTASIGVFNSGGALWLGIYDSVTAAFACWARFGGSSGTVTMQFVRTLAVNTARTFTVYIGTTQATAANGAINNYTEGSTFIVEEII